MIRFSSEHLRSRLSAADMQAMFVLNTPAAEANKRAVFAGVLDQFRLATSVFLDNEVAGYALDTAPEPMNANGWQLQRNVADELLLLTKTTETDGVAERQTFSVGRETLELDTKYRYRAADQHGNTTAMTLHDTATLEELWSPAQRELLAEAAVVAAALARRVHAAAAN
jgi:hypothetical protein